ncbi:hypothetical protein [Actinokineospora diospyrosa]|uniref:Superfamily III holin-X n=1 Tax=Actinokineospora diospyrosa TaxID=103728 RepID=A0ABT1I609_9PSEU|nr:hypothetical protein [Actinokineospora diospyrosa]MCP2268046.1 hypothetical protein [Actinokineospora diospyrosa]
MADESTWSAEPGRLGAELEDALTHAEHALEGLDRAESRMQTVRLIGLALIVLLAAATVVTWAFAPGNVAAGVLLAGLAGMSAVLVARDYAQTKSTRERERRAVVQLSRLARDLLPVVVEQEAWSELRHVTTRARIARFPISERSR